MKLIWKGIKFMGKVYVQSYTIMYADLLDKGIKYSNEI